MLFLFDTSAVSEIIRSNPRLVQRVAALQPDDRIVCCSIVRGEILFGVARLAPGKRRGVLSIKALAALSQMPCESIPPAAADRYATVKTACEQAGIALNDNDLWIASMAIELNATLITQDNDFARVEGLRTEHWT